MVEKRSKTDIIMLVVSAVLTAWLSTMERVRETVTETGEAYVSKETMFWLDIVSIVFAGILTIFGGIEVGHTEKEIKRSRNVPNDDITVAVLSDSEHPETTQVHSISNDHITINNFNITSNELSQSVETGCESPRNLNEQLNETIQALNKSYSNGNLTLSNKSGLQHADSTLSHHSGNVTFSNTSQVCTQPVVLVQQPTFLQGKPIPTVPCQLENGQIAALPIGYAIYDTGIPMQPHMLKSVIANETDSMSEDEEEEEEEITLSDEEEKTSN